MKSNGAITVTQADRWLRDVKNNGILPLMRRCCELSRFKNIVHFLYPESISYLGRKIFCLLRMGDGDVLGIYRPGNFLTRFDGLRRGEWYFCSLTKRNAAELRRTLPFTAPSVLGNFSTIFGAGDRLGNATGGHLRVFKDYKVSPVLAQQSEREITRAGRSFVDVLDSATWAVFRSGYDRPWGADGDHLKTAEGVRRVLSIGYTMVTVDVSEFIKGECCSWKNTEIRCGYRELSESRRKNFEKNYLGKPIHLVTGERIIFSEEELARTVLIYGEALDALKLYQVCESMNKGGAFDFEISIDETPFPTTGQAHVFLAKELMRGGRRIYSIAPRFAGDFQKGIDYIGKVATFEKSLRIHHSIARTFGYKVSIHSGSDKFSIYPSIRTITKGTFHLKTAGTSWLIALRVMAEERPIFFRKLYTEALGKFKAARVYYPATPEIDQFPSLDNIADDELSSLFESPEVRQLLHITYGEIFRSRVIREGLYRALSQYRNHYWNALARHLGNHLEALGVPRVS